MASKELLKAIAVTAELCGKVFSDASARVFADDLSGYDEKAVLHALSRCRKEVRGILSLQDVISRIDDGRPGVEEAWAMLPQDEDASCVWTGEMAEAWGIAAPLLADGDRVAARMAFKEAYSRLVTQAREAMKPATWTPSFGHKRDGRATAVTEAVRLGRLSLDSGMKLLEAEDQQRDMLKSLGVKNHPLLSRPSEEGRQRVESLMGNLKLVKK
jgi:hypothetical protein